SSCCRRHSTPSHSGSQCIEAHTLGLGGDALMRLPWPMPRSATRYLALLALCVVAHVASVPGALATDALPGTRPVVTWQMPTPATFPAYANITLTVNATEVGGTIANVMFFYSVGSAGKIIVTVTSSSSTYSLVWPHVAPGTYSVGALALLPTHRR